MNSYPTQKKKKKHQQQTQQQQAPQLPLERTAADDTIDVLEACGSHAQQAQWRHIWELASASYLHRRQKTKKTVVVSRGASFWPFFR